MLVRIINVAHLFQHIISLGVITIITLILLCVIGSISNELQSLNANKVPKPLVTNDLNVGQLVKIAHHPDMIDAFLAKYEAFVAFFQSIKFFYDYQATYFGVGSAYFCTQVC